MEILEESVGSVTVVRLAGKLDSDTAAETHAKILPLILEGKPILLEFTNVTHVSDAGLRTMLVIYRQAQAVCGTVSVVGLSAELRAALTATGFLRYFLVADDISVALAALQQDSHERSVLG